MWDIAEDENSIKLIKSFLAAGKPVALVCHAPGALRHVNAPEGKPLVEGKNVTGFTNGEEEKVGLTKVVPFLVEDELMRLGTTFYKIKNWGVHTVADGRLITGQNPAWSGPTANVHHRNGMGIKSCRFSSFATSGTKVLCARSIIADQGPV